MNLLKQSLSSKGYEKVEAALKTNKFLGQICSKEAILNENSYWYVRHVPIFPYSGSRELMTTAWIRFTLFGEPSETKPWGYMFFGHHLCINVFVVGQQMVIGPVFVGAEPCVSFDSASINLER